MKTVCIYPGSFCPPTYGHLSVVKQAAVVFKHVTIVCSTNAAKEDRWFSEQQCVEMWKRYILPKNTSVCTLSQFTNKGMDPSDIVMVRGIRDKSDMQHENEVMLLNSKSFNIRNYFYVFGNDQHKETSSSLVRLLAERLEIESLAQHVSPEIISCLLEKVLKIDNLFMAVGKPGSGKSTLIKMFVNKNPDCEHIDTDAYSDRLRPIIATIFPGENPLSLAQYREEELVSAIRQPWIEILKESLRACFGKKHVFVEIPYGLRDNKLLFRLVGGKILYFGCDDIRKNSKRIRKRGTPDLECFVKKIPGKSESERICKNFCLRIACVDTSVKIVEAFDNLCESIKSFS